MGLLHEYREAKRGEELARLRRAIALRAMIATGMTQREVAKAVGISQPAVSQQLTSSSDLTDVHPELLLEAATPVLKALAEDLGYRRLAAFGSIARHEASADSDIDLLVEAPPAPRRFRSSASSSCSSKFWGARSTSLPTAVSSRGGTRTFGGKRCCCDEPPCRQGVAPQTLRRPARVARVA